MSLIASSAGAIVHRVPLTKFPVTGHYQVGPSILKKNISTPQSTWIEMASEDGGSAAALGGGIWYRLKIAAMALGGRGSRKTCNDGVSIDVGIDVVKAKGLLLWR
jgi:hypothetical protein